MIDGVDAKFWLTIALYALNAAVVLYVWVSSRRAATSQSIKDLEIKCEGEFKTMAKRVLLLEADKESTLKHEDLEGIYTELRGIGKGLSKLEGRFESVDSLNAAIQHIGLQRKD